MGWWRAKIARSGVGRDFDPTAEYRMQCIRYRPVMKSTAGDMVGAHRLEHMRGMWWWKVKMVRSDMGGNFDPTAEYRMRCIRY